MFKIESILGNFFSKGNERTKSIKRNIFYSFAFKLVSIGVGLELIPLTIDYVSASQYGVWLTLSSIISWFSFFDIGLGNGLKNKLAEANAFKNSSIAKVYVSTTYAILAIISLAIICVFYIGNHFLDWSKILNTSTLSKVYLNQIALVIVTIFCIQFIVQIINIVLISRHAAAKASMISSLGQLLILMAIFWLKSHNSNGSLQNLVICMMAIPVLVQIVASMWYYNTSFKDCLPSFKSVNFKYAKELLSTGGAFLIIQIGALLLFQADNIIITQLFGPVYVTQFNVSYRLFSVIIMVFTIIMTPFWSAFTDAYAKEDFDWIKSTMLKIKKIWLAMAGSGIILFFMAPFVYKIWLNGKVEISNSLSMVMCAYIIGYTWLMLNCYFLNGIGKIKLQLYLYIGSIFINIPMAIFFGRLLGVVGVTLSNVVIFVVMGIILSVQSNKIIKQKASGIWAS